MIKVLLLGTSFQNVSKIENSSWFVSANWWFLLVTDATILLWKLSDGHTQVNKNFKEEDRDNKETWVVYKTLRWSSQTLNLCLLHAFIVFFVVVVFLVYLFICFVFCTRSFFDVLVKVIMSWTGSPPFQLCCVEWPLSVVISVPFS